MKLYDEAEERVIDLYAEFLVGEEDGTGPTWGVFRAIHAEHAPALDDIHQGRRILEFALELERQPTRRASRKVASLFPYAAAALVLVVSLAAFRTMWTETEVTRNLIAEVTPDATPEEIELAAAIAPALESSAMARSLAHSAQKSSDPSNSSAVTTLRAYADLQSHSSSRAEESAPPPELHAGMVLVIDSADRTPREVMPVSTPNTAALSAALSAQNTLWLKLIDLDRGGREVYGAQVYAEKYNLFSGQPEPRQYLGVTPLEASIGIGDFRITVLDSLARYSEFRILSAHDQPLGPQVAFIRSVSPEAEDLTEYRPTRFQFGHEPTQDAVTLHVTTETTVVDGYLLCRHEATIDQYRRFLQSLEDRGLEWFDFPLAPPQPVFDWKSYAPPHLSPHQLDGMVGDQRAIGPITWNQAVLFANWLGMRLPTDREWEQAARGPENRTYPWGDDYSEERFQTSVDGTASILERIGLVTAFPRGATPEPHRVLRMADNVTEWVEDISTYALPGNPIPVVSAGPGPSPMIHRVVRGGHSVEYIKGFPGALPGKSTVISVERRAALADKSTISSGVRCAKSSYSSIKRRFPDSN